MINPRPHISVWGFASNFTGGPAGFGSLPMAYRLAKTVSGADHSANCRKCGNIGLLGGICASCIFFEGDCGWDAPGILWADPKSISFTCQDLFEVNITFVGSMSRCTILKLTSKLSLIDSRQIQIWNVERNYEIKSMNFWKSSNFRTFPIKKLFPHPLKWIHWMAAANCLMVKQICSSVNDSK